MPNQCAETVSGALSALTEAATDFMCHHGLDEAGEPTRRCAGYDAAQAVPPRRFSARLKQASAMMPGDETFDPVRADYVRWLRIVDPADRLDDYARAAIYAQGTLLREDPKGLRPKASGPVPEGDAP